MAVLAGQRAGARAVSARWRNRLRALRYDPTPLIGATLLAILAYLVIVPMIFTLLDAVRVQFRDSALSGLRTGTWTTSYFERTFISPVSRPLFWDPLLHTLVVSAGVAALSLTLGGSLAWLLSRTDVFARRGLAAILVLPYMLPSWTFAVAWITVFKDRRLGGSQGFGESLGLTPPEWLAYGPLPIIIAESLHYFPLTLLLVGGALRTFDAQLEESAQVLGASRLDVLRRVVAPLLLPALMSALLLTFSRTVGTFGTPYILGSPVHYSVLATSLYSNFKAGSPGVSAVMALVMVALGVAMLLIDLYALREARRFVTIGGRGASRTRVRLRGARAPLTLYPLVIAIVATVLPISLLALSTVMVRPGVFATDNLTLDFWLNPLPNTITPGLPGLLRDPHIWDVAGNSLRIAASAAVAAGLAGIVIGYVVVKLPGTRLAVLLRQISFFPYLVPSIGFAAAYLSLFAAARGPIPALYGTLALVVIVMAVKYLPDAARAGIAGMMQLGREPEEAAMSLGASWSRRLLRIVLPIQRSALIIGVILPFITGMKELSLVVMLATPGTELMTTQVLRYIDFGYTQLANGLVLLIVVVVFVLVYLSQRVTRSGLTSALEG